MLSTARRIGLAAVATFVPIAAGSVMAGPTVAGCAGSTDGRCGESVVISTDYPAAAPGTWPATAATRPTTHVLIDAHAVGPLSVSLRHNPRDDPGRTSVVTSTPFLPSPAAAVPASRPVGADQPARIAAVTAGISLMAGVGLVTAVGARRFRGTRRGRPDHHTLPGADREVLAAGQRPRAVRAVRPDRSSAAPLVDVRTDPDPEPAVAGALATGADPATATGAAVPQLRLLGPVRIDGVDPERVATGKRNRLVELAAFLALHPGRTGDEVSHALGGSRPWAAPTRHSQMSRLRNWLGTGPDGEALVAPVVDGAGYRLAPAMRCDWVSFQQLARRGIHPRGVDVEVLEEALDLVTGQPFARVPDGRYGWAELVRHEMLVTVTDVAHTVAVTRLEAGDLDRARTAVHHGLEADPVSELLYRDLCRVEWTAGDLDAVDDIARRLQRIAEELDVEPESETTDLLTTMLAPRRRSALSSAVHRG